MHEPIRNARASRHDLALARPYAIAGRTIDSAENVLVELEGAHGHVGIGTASPSAAVTGETVDACLAAARAGAELARAWRGEAEAFLSSPGFEAATATAPAARAAVEMAVLDLVAREANVPLVDLLGGARHRRMPTSVTIGIQGTDATIEDARHLVDAGFRCLKIKIGNDPAADLKTLEGLRAVFGQDLTIRVDPNQGYDAPALAGFLAATRHLAIELVEQPMPRGAGAALRSIGRPGDPPFAADEDLHSPADAEALAGTSGYAAFNIKLMKCGGVLPALRIAAIAQRHGLSLMWGCMDESVVSIAAALHAAFATPATRYLDLDGSFDLAADIAAGGFVLEDGDLLLTDAPGLGASLVLGD